MKASARVKQNCYHLKCNRINYWFLFYNAEHHRSFTKLQYPPPTSGQKYIFPHIHIFFSRLLPIPVLSFCPRPTGALSWSMTRQSRSDGSCLAEGRGKPEREIEREERVDLSAFCCSVFGTFARGLSANCSRPGFLSVVWVTCPGGGAGILKAVGCCLVRPFSSLK